MEARNRIVEARASAEARDAEGHASASASARSRSPIRRTGVFSPVYTAEPNPTPMEHIVVVAGVSPCNVECIQRLHLHALVVGTATQRMNAHDIMSTAPDVETLPASAGHWFITTSGETEPESIGESCRFLFTAVRETHWACPPEILCQRTWYRTNHLEFAVIVQYQSIQPMLGIGKKLRLMLVLSGSQCTTSLFRHIGATKDLETWKVHAVVNLWNEEQTITRDRGGGPRWSSVARSSEGVGHGECGPQSN